MADLDRLFRREHGRILAHLVSWSGSWEGAEEALQDAFLAAVRTWSTNPPRNPCAWLTTVARRSLISRWRTDRGVDAPGALEAAASPEPEEADDYPDERLKLMFVCCHPLLTEEQRVALTLHSLGGLTTAEIAAGYLVSVPTMAQRLVRARRRIALAGIGFQIPPPEALAERIDGVLQGLYLIFTEGYASTGEDALIREDLCQEALRLVRSLERWLREVRSDVNPTQRCETLGLMSLMILHEARRSARLSDDGSVVLLADQDRSRWDSRGLAEGRAILEAALSLGHPGPYQIQAAILQVHSEAARADQTDWVQITGLYRQLLLWIDTPVVRLNAAVAIAQVAGPQAALDLLLALEPDLVGYAPFHLARAQLWEQAGNPHKALREYRRAGDLTRNSAERRALQERIGRLDDVSGPGDRNPEGPADDSRR